MNDILLNGLVGVVTAFITWLLAKKKYNAEVDHSVIDNMKEALSFYQAISDDNKRRLDENQKKLDEVQKENFLLREQVNSLNNKINCLMSYNCMRCNCKNRITNTTDTNINREEF